MSSRWQPTLWAGLVGGVLAGAGDALVTFAAGLSRPSAPDALVLGGVAGATLGLGLALVAVLLHAVAVPLAACVRRISPSALVAMTMTAPLLVYDAFALFAGAKASRLAGHQVISVALVLLMLALVALAGRLWERLLVHVESAPGRGGAAGAVGLVLLAVAAGAEQANRVVLPRLYLLSLIHI